jgi:hypothetical protein
MYNMEVLQFNGQDDLKYKIWSKIMKSFLQEQGCDIW